LVGITLLTGVSRWHVAHRIAFAHAVRPAAASPLPPRTVAMAIGILLLLIFSKFFYVAGLSSFYTFYLIDKFGVSVQASQYLLFVFLLASAVGTLLGGALVDRLGQKPVIWASILGIAPFALMLPYVNLFWTVTFTVLIGLILSSAFSAILVYAQELIPGKVGMVSGLFFGLAFGMGGLGAALLGVLADHTSIEFVYRVIAFLPLIGMVTAFLPKVRRTHG
jgi:FSR family fosmidomycin resistance protein-like MFS transporter